MSSLFLYAILNWCAPFLLAWIYPVGMMLVFKDFKFTGFEGPFAKFELVKEGVEPWHRKLWKDWAGVGLPGFFCYGVPLYKAEDSDCRSAWLERTIKHEKAHCWQWLALGLLFPVSYYIHALFILLFRKDKHAYLDCWAERAARKHAGQKVDIPKEEWPQGPADRWPWW
jgi:hypothetical protein